MEECLLDDKRVQNQKVYIALFRLESAMEGGLVDFFEQYLEHSTVFAAKEVLQANHMPAQIPHRQAQIEACARVLAPALRGQKPSNLFVYGHPGTGKTLVLQHVT